MRTMRRVWRAPLRALAGSAALATLALLQVSAQDNDRFDADAVARIRDEGMQRSQVMEIMSYLTDVYGPRLTGSPNTRAAGEWTVQRMKTWGISSPRFE